MRKLFNEFFYIPKYGKVREKVMLTRLTMMITIVIVCLAAMSITAYAYFSYNVTSGLNTIKSANFETSISIQITDSDGKAVDTPKPITTNYKLYKIADLKVGEWYTVTVTPTERSTAKTGFIIVTATGCNEIYHTQQLGIDENVPGGKTPEIKFQLMITDTTDVVLEAHWGTSSYYPKFKDTDDDHYITYKDGQMEQVKMIVNGIVNPVVDSDTEENKTPTEGITPPATVTTPPSTESTTPSTTITTPPVSTETTEPTATETTTPSEQIETVETQPQATTETQPAEETTGAPTTEASE